MPELYQVIHSDCLEQMVIDASVVSFCKPQPSDETTSAQAKAQTGIDLLVDVTKANV